MVVGPKYGDSASPFEYNTSIEIERSVTLVLRFLPTLLVLILIFGVHPLQFALILAIVVAGLAFGCHSNRLPDAPAHENCSWCHWTAKLFGHPAPAPAAPQYHPDDRKNF